MASFFVGLFVVLLVAVEYGDSAIDPCINPVYGRFIFQDCVEGEIAIRWNGAHSLRLRLFALTKYEQNRFVLNINDYCQLWFYGRMGEVMPLARWEWEDYSTLAVCIDPSNCDLKIDTNGTLRRMGPGASRQPICSHMNLRNRVNDQWVWTKIRVSGLPAGWLFLVDVANPDTMEVTEYNEVPSCFKPIAQGGGFRFKGCSYGRLSLKWPKDKDLIAIHSIPAMNTVQRQFQLFINEQCSLYFAGIYNEAESYAQWKTGDANGTVLVNCKTINDCTLIIDTNGMARLLTSPDTNSLISLCNETTVLRNTLDDNYVWTTLRIVEYPERWVMGTYALNTQPGEVAEYHRSVPRDPCINSLPDYRGFVFRNCKDGEVKIKWLMTNNFYLITSHIGFASDTTSNFTLIVNDQCTLHLIGKSANRTWVQWWNKSRTTRSYCDDINQCSLKIDIYGALRLATSTEYIRPQCPRSALLRNAIDDIWVWTKIRIIGLESDWLITAIVPKGGPGEGFEFVPK
ncbi:hypothetical protein M3Y94_00665800 [Aphelenchoides besseyi]|nr:hypothetical protein M3Y94_00665800 [Aphelenchoides besseyi]KAI6231281.1 hypothetical protein M3Y95_00364900 [Aphelenchoides besseyi]